MSTALWILVISSVHGTVIDTYAAHSLADCEVNAQMTMLPENVEEVYCQQLGSGDRSWIIRDGKPGWRR